MSTVLILIAAAAFVTYLALLRSVVAGDGYGHRAASGLPRSHRPDAFESRRLV